MKKKNTLVFYIKNNNKKIVFKSILDLLIDPICDFFNEKIYSIDFYTDDFEEEIERKCKYSDYGIFKDFYIDLKNEQLQQLSFVSKSETFEGWPIFRIKLAYQYDELELRIDIFYKKIDLQQYMNLIRIISNFNFDIITSFLYSYRDCWNTLLLSGSEIGFMTHKKKELLNRILKHMHDDFSIIVGVFEINYINKNIISQNIITEIKKIVGIANFIENNNSIIFQCKNNRIKRKVEKALKITK